jgi:hypothetical protein
MKMSRFRLGIRVMVFTIAFGLFSVSVYYKISNHFNEIPVALPRVESGSPLIVKPETEKFNNRGGGGGG